MIPSPSENASAKPLLSRKEFEALRPLLSRRELAAYLGMSERASYAITSADWFATIAAPIELSPRVLKWRRTEVDEALAKAPRRGTTAPEPSPLRHSREQRKAVQA